GGAATGSPGVPRPGRERGDAVRGGPRARGRGPAARPVAAGQRPRAPPQRRGSVRRAARGGDTVSATIPKRTETRVQGGTAGVEKIDRRSIAAELRAAIEGEVRFDTASRALYAT